MTRIKPNIGAFIDITHPSMATTDLDFQILYLHHQLEYLSKVIAIYGADNEYEREIASVQLQITALLLTTEEIKIPSQALLPTPEEIDASTDHPMPSPQSLPLSCLTSPISSPA